MKKIKLINIEDLENGEIIKTQKILAHCDCCREDEKMCFEIKISTLVIGKQISFYRRDKGKICSDFINKTFMKFDIKDCESDYTPAIGEKNIYICFDCIKKLNNFIR